MEKMASDMEGSCRCIDRIIIHTRLTRGAPPVRWLVRGSKSFSSLKAHMYRMLHRALDVEKLFGTRGKFL
jgi:hypothetical protein